MPKTGYRGGGGRGRGRSSTHRHNPIAAGGRGRGRGRGHGGRGRGRSNRSSIGNNATQHSRKRKSGNGGGRGYTQNRSNNNLKPIHVEKHSIHGSWKKQLGGLIRLYINKHLQNTTTTNTEAATTKQLMKELEQIYTSNKCSIPATKQTLLQLLGVSTENQNVTLSLALESSKTKIPLTKSTLSTLHSLPLTIDSKGLILPTIQCPGEGPAHAHESWTMVSVPSFCLHNNAYYFQVENTTTLDLSCEVTIDGHLVAKNVPVPQKSIRTIRPDKDRYFERHQWVFESAKRVKIGDNHNSSSTTTSTTVNQQKKKNGKRYNNTRPSDLTKRVPLTLYPDPTQLGWTFTGSAEQSSVEFFEKKLNIGIVKLDWYYTTATMKTTLDHPTNGRNALFRNTVDGEMYKRILENPRVHTDRGYRSRMDRGKDDAVFMEEEEYESEEENNMEEDGMNDNDNSDENNPATTTTTYYAKNDNYDFQNQGHLNRQNAMTQLYNTSDFQAWEKAAQQEYSFVHAKFYVSLPRYKSRHNNNNNNNRRGASWKEVTPEELPEQASVMDVKSSENATLGTKFSAVGTSQNSRNVKRSNVRMQRIYGLNDGDGNGEKDKDDEGGRAAPVFECKLYYRAEEVLSKQDADEDDEDDDDAMEDEDHAMNTNETSSSSPTTTLEEYKTEILQQISNLHKDRTMNQDDADTEENDDNKEDANEMLTKTQNQIIHASNQKGVDEARKIYWDWNQKLGWGELLMHQQQQEQKNQEGGGDGEAEMGED